MMEQLVIRDPKLAKHGGKLLNERNSISKRNPLYKKFISVFGEI
jgi:hypothetical protein